MNLIKIFITAFLIDNVVLLRFIALCPFIGMSSDEDKSIGMGMAVIFVTVLATCVTWPIYRFILEPLGLVFLQILFVESIVYAIGVALGFLLAMLLLAGIRKKIRTSLIPAFLKGPPILFISTCLLSMAFMGFSGLIK